MQGIAGSTPFQRRADRVRPAASGHDFFTSRQIRRAHCRRLLEAAAAAVALFEVAGERAVLGRKGELRLERQFQIVIRSPTQMPVYFVMAIRNDLAGIEHVVRVKGVLDLLHQAIQFIADLGFQKFRARDADAMFARQRTLELGNEHGDFIGDLPEFLQIIGPLQIEHWSDMQ